jgi:Helicase HerA, central domain
VCSLRGSGWRIEAGVGGQPAPMRLDAVAVAELWGLAAASSDGRAVDVVRSRRLRAPIVEPGPGMRPIAMDGGRAVMVPDSLFSRHLFLLGRTGAGKSMELVALAADDLQAGRGFTLIDPHGDAVARLLDAVPEDQAHRVHLLELAEKDRPRAFNPIELDGADPELVAAQFVDTMRDLHFATLGTAHRQVQYLRNALMTLLTMPSSDGRPWTLESLYSLFVDPAFCEDFTRGLKDPVLAAFWSHQWQQGARGGDPSADALVSKLGAFLGYPSIRAIVSAPVSTIRPRQIMDAGDVLLVDLSGVGRDHMRLFGRLVVARYNVAALGRQRVPAADRTPHALDVDEVQNFDTTSLRSTPAEGHKFGLQIHMATQYMRALGQELQSAIRANVSTTILLQPSAEDVRLLGDLLVPLTERDLVNLPRFRMAIRTELDGESRVMTADVLPEPERLGFGGLVPRLSDERDGQLRLPTRWRATVVLIVALIGAIGGTRGDDKRNTESSADDARPEPDSLRSPAGAVWPALPERDRNLLLWLLSADIVTASLASVLVYGNLRTAQRRLARLTELGVLRGFWAAGRHRPPGRHAFVLTRQARLDIERIVWPAGRPGRARDLPPSAAIHQLATHDLFAAFLHGRDPLLREGIFAWIPERACAQLFGGSSGRTRSRVCVSGIERSPCSSSATWAPSEERSGPGRTVGEDSDFSYLQQGRSRLTTGQATSARVPVFPLRVAESATLSLNLRRARAEGEVERRAEGGLGELRQPCSRDGDDDRAKPGRNDDAAAARIGWWIGQRLALRGADRQHDKTLAKDDRRR